MASYPPVNMGFVPRCFLTQGWLCIADASHVLQTVQGSRMFEDCWDGITRQSWKFYHAHYVPLRSITFYVSDVLPSFWEMFQRLKLVGFSENLPSLPSSHFAQQAVRNSTPLQLDLEEGTGVPFLKSHSIRHSIGHSVAYQTHRILCRRLANYTCRPIESWYVF